MGLFDCDPNPSVFGEGCRVFKTEMSMDQVTFKPEMSMEQVTFKPEFAGFISSSSFDPSLLFKIYDSKYEFPNIGDSNYFYVDRSTGDVFLWGITGASYTSVGTASGDTIYAGSAVSAFPPVIPDENGMFIGE